MLCWLASCPCFWKGKAVERTLEAIIALDDRFAAASKRTQKEIRDTYPLATFMVVGAVLGYLDVAGITDKGWKEIEKIANEL
jgi:putative lipase involved disintegration of autophagic bodies